MKYVIIVIVLVLIYIVYYFYTLSESIDITPKVKKVFIQNLLKGQIGFVFDLFADNKSSKSISVKDIYIEVYYLNKLVAKTPKSNNNLYLASNAKNYLALKDIRVDFIANKESGKMISDYMANKPLALKIKLKATLFLIPISVSTDYTYTQ